MLLWSSVSAESGQALPEQTCRALLVALGPSDRRQRV